jgi:hypothetical protein
MPVPRALAAWSRQVRWFTGSRGAEFSVPAPLLRATQIAPYECVRYFESRSFTFAFDCFDQM